MKIQTSKVNRVNLKVQILDDLTLHFNGDRIAELEDESRLKELMAKDKSISVVGSKPKVETVKQTDSDVEGVKVSEGTGEEMTGTDVTEGETAILTNDEVGEQVEQDNVTIATSEDKEDGVETDLSEIKMPDLKELCRDSGFPEEEWKSFKKKDDLVAYMEEKLKGE